MLLSMSLNGYPVASNSEIKKFYRIGTCERQNCVVFYVAEKSEI